MFVRVFLNICAAAAVTSCTLSVRACIASGRGGNAPSYTTVAARAQVRAGASAPSHNVINPNRYFNSLFRYEYRNA